MFSYSRREELDMSRDSWLVLAQAGYQLQPVAADLRSNGYLFNYRGSRSIGEKISDAVNGWTDLQKGKRVWQDRAKHLQLYVYG